MKNFGMNSFCINQASLETVDTLIKEAKNIFFVTDSSGNEIIENLKKIANVRFTIINFDNTKSFLYTARKAALTLFENDVDLIFVAGNETTFNIAKIMWGIYEYPEIKLKNIYDFKIEKLDLKRKAKCIFISQEKLDEDYSSTAYFLEDGNRFEIDFGLMPEIIVQYSEG